MKQKAMLAILLAMGCLVALVPAGSAMPPLDEDPGIAEPVQIQGTPLGEYINYQGYLMRRTGTPGPVSGNYYFEARLYDAATGGNQIGNTHTNDLRTLADGYFRLQLNFGRDAFNGEARWIEFWVMNADYDTAYTKLEPRQRVDPVPYALALPALRIKQINASPHLVGGHTSNWTDPYSSGATIGGGGNSTNPNLVEDDYGTVAGGEGNKVVGRWLGTAQHATVSGGKDNTARARGTVVGGGRDNLSSDHYCTIGGGYDNQTGNDGEDPADTPYATVGGGAYNSATGAQSTISGGTLNFAAGEAATVGGGKDNSAAGEYATVGGGSLNYALGEATTVAGGRNSTVYGSYGAIGGGGENYVYEEGGTISGGYDNVVHAHGGTIGGGDQHEILAGANYSTIGGGLYHYLRGEYGTIGGGFGNNASGPSSTVGGGTNNKALTEGDTVAGGTNNSASGASDPLEPGPATVGGGASNSAVGPNATISGGLGNQTEGAGAVIGGGYFNVAASSASVGGGMENHAEGYAATVPGGSYNVASGDMSFAAGNSARAVDAGSFVWGDSTFYNIVSAGTDTFVVRANGGLWFGAAEADLTPVIGPGVLIATSTGAYLSTGGAWTNESDAAMKENYASLDGKSVLARLEDLPVGTWNYRSQDSAIRHAGPTAQDFHDAFGLGEDNEHIATVDADGVALAAIQGLYQIIQEQDAEIAVLEGEQAELRNQLDELAARVSALEDRPDKRLAGTTTWTGSGHTGWLLLGLLPLGLGSVWLSHRTGVLAFARRRVNKRKPEQRRLSAPLFLAMVLLGLAVASLALAGVADAEEPGYEINPSSVDSGSGWMSGGDYSMTGTLGAGDAGTLSGGDYAMEGGFGPPPLTVDYGVYVPLITR